MSPPTPPSDHPPRRFSRRRLLLRIATGGMIGGSAIAGAGVYARHIEPFWPATGRITMDLENLPPDLVGLRLLHLSDLHVDSDTSAAYVAEQLATCNRLHPDLVVITGDFITAINRRWIDRLPGLLETLQARCGVFAVLGNHDFGVHSPFRHPRGSHLADRVQGALELAGVTVLRNATRVVRVGNAGLQLVGVEDEWSGFCEPAVAFEHATSDLPTIVLTHNPDTMTTLRNWPADWVLCGHTHGGQVRFPLYGAPHLPVEHREWDAGRFEIGDKVLYVNRGLGCLSQVRFNCRPEIALFELALRA